MSLRWKPWCVVVLLALAVGCQSGGSGVSRANGGCYASCPTGTTEVQPPQEAKSDP